VAEAQDFLFVNRVVILDTFNYIPLY